MIFSYSFRTVFLGILPNGDDTRYFIIHDLRSFAFHQLVANFLIAASLRRANSIPGSERNAHGTEAESEFVSAIGIVFDIVFDIVFVIDSVLVLPFSGFFRVCTGSSGFLQVSSGFSVFFFLPPFLPFSTEVMYCLRAKSRSRLRKNQVVFNAGSSNSGA